MLPQNQSRAHNSGVARGFRDPPTEAFSNLSCVTSAANYPHIYRRPSAMLSLPPKCPEKRRTVPLAVSLQAQLERARRNGLSPNLINYNACVDVCAKTGEVDRALALLEQMQTSGDPALTPDLVT